MKTQPRENERRDSVIIIVLILLFGFVCIIIASGWALRFAPNWKLNTNMGSNLDPNSDFLTSRPVSFIEPLDPAILTNPAWMDVFLTPGASFPTRTPLPASTATPVPVRTSTPLTTTVTATTVVNPTNTLIYFPPTRTLTPRPPSTNTPITPVTPLSSADLQIFKTDGMTTYNPGGTLIYSVIVQNNGASAVTGAVVTDNKPTQVTSWSWACTSQTGGATGCNAVAGSTANFTDTVNLPNGASIVYTVTANISAAATGNLVNSATIASGLTDPIPGNNTATDTDAPPLTADLGITKTDGVTTYTPGGAPLAYTITVINNGPAAVTGAIITDNFPTQIATWDWACTAQTGGANGCTPVTGSVSDFADGVNLPVGASVVYTVTANISPTATGNLVNRVDVAVPVGYTDPTPGNDFAIDTDTATPTVDLSITKTNSVATVVSGGTTIYTVRVTNNGPSSVTGATLSDPAATGLSKTSVACSATPGQCVTPPSVAQLETGAFALPALASGQFYEITITANVTALSGSVTNIATVAAPVGTNDPTPGNNSAADTDAVGVEGISITKDDGVTEYTPGGTLSYTITVTNTGTLNLTGVTLSDALPPTGQITDWTWSCNKPIPVCASTLVMGDYSATFDLLAGDTIIFTANANISAAASGNLTNTAIVTTLSTLSASDADTDYTSIYGNIGTGQDGNIELLTPGNTPLILALSPQVQVVGPADVGVWDIIYYEQAVPGGIDMDQIILEVGDGGSTWYPILNWGDGASDVATSIAIPLGPPNPTTCTGEPDNCFIDTFFLDSGTGVRIDLDNPSLGIPPGIYPFLRIRVTIGGNVGIDGIYVIP